ncbi:MAG: Branched-chain amino acid transport ATP-binding protein LivF [Candidatus Carbobacillus altaicus]|uniref:Branched-chain amino acid transport ATP-binding protein LivF n=1 Tax=Candidatus Carbonibacillus altaicus TaxID=2163959 RepID=A0A2R6XY20_9BACL|nr:MAG: Branched-chain amino acid transport ATP-binding protein LivF [Candidatus Carbobacillus altaicus]
MINIESKRTKQDSIKTESMKTDSVMLEINDVVSAYGPIRAVKGVSLKIEKGRIVALIGANGAGKTTLMKTIAGLMHPVSGTIVLEGRRIDQMRAHRIARLGLSLVPEGRAILGRMTVQENLEMGAYPRRDTKGIQDDLAYVYTLFPILQERRSQVAGTLSGGQQQMLAIGRALMARPHIILFDEPSMGLAPLVVSEIFRVIEAINRRGTTVFIVEQNVKQVLKIAHYAYVLENGKITLDGPTEQLAQDARIVQAYLGGGKTG